MLDARHSVSKAPGLSSQSLAPSRLAIGRRFASRCRTHVIAPPKDNSATNTNNKDATGTSPTSDFWSVVSGTSTGFASQVLSHFQRHWPAAPQLEETQAAKVDYISITAATAPTSSPVTRGNPRPFHVCMQVIQAAASLERVTQTASPPLDCLRYLTPVGVWEIKRIRMLSHLCSLTYKMATLTVS